MKSLRDAGLNRLGCGCCSFSRGSLLPSSLSLPTCRFRNRVGEETCPGLSASSMGELCRRIEDLGFGRFPVVC